MSYLLPVPPAQTCLHPPAPGADSSLSALTFVFLLLLWAQGHWVKRLGTLSLHSPKHPTQNTGEDGSSLSQYGLFLQATQEPPLTLRTWEQGDQAAF